MNTGIAKPKPQARLTNRDAPVPSVRLAARAVVDVFRIRPLGLVTAFPPFRTCLDHIYKSSCDFESYNERFVNGTSPFASGEDALRSGVNFRSTLLIETTTMYQRCIY